METTLINAKHDHKLRKNLKKKNKTKQQQPLIFFFLDNVAAWYCVIWTKTKTIQQVKNNIMNRGG